MSQNHPFRRRETSKGNTPFFGSAAIKRKYRRVGFSPGRSAERRDHRRRGKGLQREAAAKCVRLPSAGIVHHYPGGAESGDKLTSSPICRESLTNSRGSTRGKTALRSGSPSSILTAILWIGAFRQDRRNCAIPIRRQVQTISLCHIGYAFGSFRLWRNGRACGAGGPGILCDRFE